MLRAVIDTNVLLSALLWRGTPYALLQHAGSGVMGLVSSPALLAELADVLARPKFATALERNHIAVPALMAQLQILLEVIHPPPLAQPVCRDPDDDAVLALALAAQADVVISGDDDLLTLRVFAGIPIITATQALERLQPVY